MAIAVLNHRRETSIGSASAPAETYLPRVYLLELWSFIPYYVAALSLALEDTGARVVLGSTRYHLDRNYFEQAGANTDRCLIDIGGGLRNRTLRRIVKSAEYVFNLGFLLLRFAIARPDVLHVQYLPFLDRGTSFELWFLRLAHRLGVRIVHTAHNVTNQNQEHLNTSLYAHAYQMADAIICHGEQARTRLENEFAISSSKIRVIPHGPLFQCHPDCSPAEAREKLGLPGVGPLVVCAGVISEYKGIPFLLRAWERVVQNGCRGKLLIAGTGDPQLLNDIRNLLVSLRIADSVELRLTFISVEELPLIHHAADILVYPYKAGTTSGALLTGMQYQKAVVATDLPVFREHLRNQHNALLVPFGDESSLAQALLQLMQSPYDRERLARALYSESQSRMSWAAIAQRTVDCYRTFAR